MVTEVRIQRKTDKEYVEAGEWKCASSPTGAHHWIGNMGKGKEYFKCKWCQEEIGRND